MLHALQVFGQCLAAWLGAWRLGCGRGLGQAGLQGGQLRPQARLVLGQRVLEQQALLGRHGLGPGTELPALEPRELEVDLLQLRIAPGDLAVFALELGALLFDLRALVLDLAELALQLLILQGELFVLLLDMLEHLRGQRRQA